jgi:hypothetical protein
MPSNKDLKRLVRARMRKTGEAYTAARAQIVKKPQHRSPNGAPAARSAGAASGEFASLAGMSDAAVKEHTGCTWDRWVRALDQHGAAAMPHRDIVTLVSTKYKVPDWWSQMVTVGYERIKGLRARGQRRDGSYEATKSRTFGVPVATLFDAWADARRRKAWLGERVTIRTATAPKSMRIGWSDGSIIAVGFYAKGASKSSVAVSHAKLPDRDTAERLKQYWTERLDALGDSLSAT